jgi:hypothetical protein
MKKLGLGVAIVAIVVGCVWFVKQYRCHKRNAEFTQRIAAITRDADEQLKIGTKKADVARFYTEHKIHFQVIVRPDGGYEAIGALYTIGGCAPLGCGTDRALIGVRAKVDGDGTVIAKPEVADMYVDCF